MTPLFRKPKKLVLTKEITPPKPAWWSLCAQPDQRSDFMQAAKQRAIDRAVKSEPVYLPRQSSEAD